MTITIDDPEFLASWQEVEKCLRCLDENQVERLFSKEYASLSDFHQALADEMDLKKAALSSTISSLEAENETVRKETSEIKAATKKLREERMEMEVKINEEKRKNVTLRDFLKTRKLDKKK